MGSHGNRARMAWCGRGLLAAAAALSLSMPALAAVRREGVWPEKEPTVSLDLKRVPRDEAIKSLAEAAGWSVVVHAPAGDPVDVHVKDQPAGKVLDLLLMDGNYVANRDGALIAVVRGEAASADAPRGNPTAASPIAPPAPLAPPAPPAPPRAAPEPPPPPAPPLAPPAPSVRGGNRVVTVENLKIPKGEVVHDVSVFGGSLDVYGAVTGDISLMGGSVRVHEGARVMGDVEAAGGTLIVENGARIDGDVEMLGGSVKQGETAIIGGEVKTNGREIKVDVDFDDDPPLAAEHEAREHREPTLARSARSTGSRIAHRAGKALTSMSLLFVVGAVLLALASGRMEKLKVEVAARPMRSFAMGVVGVIAGAALLVALCVTIIGIPFAIIGLLAAFMAAWAGICAVLETVGGALLGHRTRNNYVHLAAGCGVFLVLTSIPYVAGFAIAAVVLTGIGVLVATRLAGLIPQKAKPGSMNGGSPPYRAAPTF